MEFQSDRRDYNSGEERPVKFTAHKLSGVPPNRVGKRSHSSHHKQTTQTKSGVRPAGSGEMLQVLLVPSKKINIFQKAQCTR